jgi:hypothetical protein
MVVKTYQWGVGSTHDAEPQSVGIFLQFDFVGIDFACSFGWGSVIEKNIIRYKFLNNKISCSKSDFIQIAPGFLA